ncbi:MAG: hypothetical protein U0V48_13560 [Anaerolineales bacterium]
MNSSEFNAYKTRYRAAIRRVLADSEKGRLDEAGFPAYSSPNLLINWLFWKRLYIAMNHIEKSAPYENILDFGCERRDAPVSCGEQKQTCHRD